MTRRHRAWLALALLATALLAGCGKKGLPHAPEDAQGTTGRSYPKP